MEEKSAFFEPTTAEEWKKLIIKELRDVPYEQLLWSSVPGITVSPDNTKEDWPGEITFCPKNRKDEGWLVREDLEVNQVSESNKAALKLLQSGVSAIGFRGKIHHADDLKSLLDQIELPYIAVYFDTNGNPVPFADAFTEFLRHKGYDPQTIRGGLAFDPISGLLERGNWNTNEIRDKEQTVQLLEIIAENQLQRFTPVRISASIYEHSGANVVTQLAAALAHANEYLSWAHDAGIDVRRASKGLYFQFSCGRSYYSEIARLRAFRPLWANVCSAWGIDPQKAAEVVIGCETSRRERTDTDEYTNLLRNTTEAMSAVIGGCDYLRVLPHNLNSQDDNSFSQRIARNIQLILGEESGMNFVSDPAAGSYLFDKLSLQMMKETWIVFQEIESQGGLVATINNGWLQERIAREAELQEEAAQSGKNVFIGVNKYPDGSEQKKSISKETYPGANSLESRQVQPLNLRNVVWNIQGKKENEQ
jgi:methylmalonyl-CoA mutase